MIEHLNVSDSSVEFRAGSDGKFLFENLAPGSWRFTASSQSFGTSSGHVDAQITPDGDPVERDILLSSRRLGGRVIDEAGKPVADATVDLRYTDGRGNYGAVSDESGRFEFSMPVPPATYKIQATHATKGRTLFLPFQMPETGQPPALNLTLVSTPAQITCTVLSILDGLPVSGPSAELRSGSEMVASAGNSFNPGQDVVIFDVQPGGYQLVVTAPGYSEASHSITVEPGQSQAFTDVLSPAAEVTVQVVDKNGYSISRAAVTITPAQSDTLQPPQSSATDETGIAKFAGILYGTYQVQAITPTGAAASGALSTQNQKSTRFRLQVD